MREILKFINHASFIVETSNSILLVDPWVEGYVFDNGWSLLDKSTSNKELCGYLKKQSKSLFIWYSHEHPDHFSVSFIKELKRHKLNAKFFFQHTLDKRLASFLRKNNFEIKESNFVKESIEEKFNLITFPYEDGDSFLLILVNGKSILNLNDCVIDTKKKSWKLNKQLSKYCSKIDIMMTQFGYANWIGNPDQIMLRRIASNEKINRIKLQNKIINPKTIIPFASFVSFCHKENFYMNDVQNTPLKIYKSKLSHEFRDKMIIMKPWDEIDLKNLKLNNIKLLKFQNNAIYWDKLFQSIRTETYNGKIILLGDLSKLFINYQKEILRKFWVVPKFLEIIGFIKPLKIFIKDLNKMIKLSYINGLEIIEKEEHDIIINSETLFFVLKFEFGANTLSVNAKYRCLNNKSNFKFLRFFSPQKYLRNGYSLKNFYKLFSFS